MKQIFVLIILVTSFKVFAQTKDNPSLFGRKWISSYMATISQGTPLESAFPSGFQFTKEKNKVYRYSYVTMPGNPTDTFSTALDTLDLRKKVTAFSKAGRKMETTISISKDEKQIHIKRDYYYAYDPKKLEFSYDDVYKIQDNGDVILEKTAKATDPDSDFNFVGTKLYPQDGQVKETN